MKRYVFVIVAVLSFGNVLFSAEPKGSGSFTLTGRIATLESGNLMVNAVLGHRELTIAETQTDLLGNFKFEFPPTTATGQYRLRFESGNNEAAIDLILYGGDIELFTHASAPTDSLQLAISPANVFMLEYFRTQELVQQRLSILDHILNIYPEDERFYPQIIAEFNLLQDEMQAKVQKAIKDFKGTFAERYILSDRSPRLDPTIPQQERLQYFRTHFLNYVDFSDTALLRSDLFSHKAITYLMLHRNPRYDLETQAQEFIRGVDFLLPVASIEPSVFNYLLEYVISGFEQIGLDKVLSHIAQNYRTMEGCLFDTGAAELERRMEGYRKLVVGKKAPNIKDVEINGTQFDLSELPFARKLIIFWASWCPHCIEMLPAIATYQLAFNARQQNNEDRLLVVAVSIDVDEQAYLNYLSSNQLNHSDMHSVWLNVRDGLGWDGKTATDFYLHATPTMLLLDRDLNILLKPGSVAELRTYLGI
ncbi:MAG TPA: TlpA disulfide reductase family protein [Bacteroidales bacterium]|nr:TlpA disulfide reductase family protein [Bacteroidales bacterium]